MDREEWLTRGIDRETAIGVEIGPFHSPLAPKCGGWRTVVVDYTDGDDLRRIAAAHSDDNVRSRVELIEDVDVVWRRDVDLDAACLNLHPQGFDYLIASHVIEHIPNIIGFLQQVSRLARGPDFVLSLAVPDCRLTFDVFKPLSDTADALLAHRENRMIHAAETAFRSLSYMAWRGDDGAAWVPGDDRPFRLMNSLRYAHHVYLDNLRDIAHGTQGYIDQHCWYCTPSSFELLILELNALRYIDFIVSETEPGPCSEFLTRLTKRSHGLDEDQLNALRLALMIETRRELADALAPEPAPA